MMKQKKIYFCEIIKISSQMQQIVFYLSSLFIVISLCITGCRDEKVQEENPEIIAANLLKQGTADINLLPGKWNIIKFAYTKDGNEISDKNAIIYSDFQLHPYFIIPDEISNEWFFQFVNQHLWECSITRNLISYSSIKSITYIYIIEGTETHKTYKELILSLKKSYSFVIRGNELIIYYQGSEGKNLLILEKQ